MPTFIDMFAGAGGFSEGFLQAEYKDRYYDFLLASDIMYFVVCFGRPFGKNQSWADVSGNGRSEVENNAVPKGDILEARQIFYMQRCVRSSFRSSNPQPQSVKQAWAHSIRPLSLNRISMSVPFTFFNMIRRSSCSMNPSFTSVIGFLSMA